MVISGSSGMRLRSLNELDLREEHRTTEREGLDGGSASVRRVQPGSAPHLCSRERSPSCTVARGAVYYRLCESAKIGDDCPKGQRNLFVEMPRKNPHIQK